MGGRWELLLLALIATTVIAEEEALPDGPLFIVEKRGNTSLECIRSAPCGPCSFAEKQSDDIYHCSATGYYMSYHCVEVNDTATPVFESGKFESQQQSTPSDGSSNKLNQKVIVLNKSCVPAPVQDRLTVFGFEGIMLGLLAVFSPVLYYRKKRASAASGMTRVPTSRF